jgi:uncharacterized protein YceK
MKYILMFLIILLSISGCTARFKNLSEHDGYINVIGKKYTTTEDLKIYGFTLTLEKNPRLDGYTIHPIPGIGGQEILSSELLPAGEIFTVEKVEKCSNCFPFPAYIVYVIKFDALEKFNHKRITLGTEVLKNKVKPAQ